MPPLLAAGDEEEDDDDDNDDDDDDDEEEEEEEGEAGEDEAPELFESTWHVSLSFSFSTSCVHSSHLPSISSRMA